MSEVTEKIREIFIQEGSRLIEPLHSAIQKTQKDVSGLKTDMSSLKDVVDGHTVILSDILEDSSAMKNEIVGVREVVDGHTVTFDGMVGSLETLRTEFSVNKYRTDRHEGWISKLAEKVGLHLSH